MEQPSSVGPLTIQPKTQANTCTVQAPMLGYWLAFPVVCVLLERLRRLYLTFCGHHLARLQALDDGTVVITAERKNGRNWHTQAGQFVHCTSVSLARLSLTLSCRYSCKCPRFRDFNGTLSQSVAVPAIYYNCISKQMVIGRPSYIRLLVSEEMVAETARCLSM